MKFRNLLIVAVFAFFVSFFIYQGRAFLLSPTITLTSPESKNVTVSEESIIISGNTARASNFFINEERAELKPDGSFSYEFDLNEGKNKFILRVSNKFDLSNTFTVEVTRKPL